MENLLKLGDLSELLLDEFAASVSVKYRGDLLLLRETLNRLRNLSSLNRDNVLNACFEEHEHISPSLDNVDIVGCVDTGSSWQLLLPEGGDARRLRRLSYFLQDLRAFAGCL